MDDAEWAPAQALGAPPLALPDKPSIAVLPFQNLSGDPSQEYFADGIVEDIITALSRMRWLFVIARNSSFTYKGRAVNVKQVGRELGVRYVVEGGVRRAVNRIRITTQLIDAMGGTHIWADRFDGTLDNVFDMQDQVAISVVGAIARNLERAEIERAKHKPTENLDAYDYFLRGMAHFHQRTRDAFTAALPLFYKAIELDADFASACGMAAQCYFWRKMNGWMMDPAREIAEGARLARLAVQLGEDDAVALTRGGHSLAHLTGDLDSGIAFIDRALLLNPNLATAWYLGGTLRAFRGEPEIASEHLIHAMRLSPLDPEMFRMHMGMAFAHWAAGRFDESSASAEQALRALPNFLPALSMIAASYAQAGHMEKARDAVQRLREYNPTLRISNVKEWLPWRRPEDFARWTEGLRKSGLSE
jgi:TolB-like protein